MHQPQVPPQASAMENFFGDLRAAMDVYFAAKAQMFASVPSFGMLRVGPLICFHNHPGWPEVDGFYAVDGDTAPDEILSAVSAYRPAPDHMITLFTASADVTLSTLRPYEEHGYQALPEPQPFMSNPLTTSINTVSRNAVANTAPVVPIVRVETLAQVDFINAYEEEPVMKSEHLNNLLYRYYYAERDGKPVCWGRCVVATPNAIYVAGMETLPQYRRCGLATALMHRMHADALASGAKQSVLCSSTLGFSLYNRVGYAVKGYMQAFVPQIPNAP